MNDNSCDVVDERVIDEQHDDNDMAFVENFILRFYYLFQ